MSVQAMAWAFDQTVHYAPKSVLLSLANHANSQGTDCYPGQGTIAREAGMSERSVRKYLHVLEDAGLISRQHRRRADGRGRTSDCYVLHMLPHSEQQADRASRREDPHRPTGNQTDQPAAPSGENGSTNRQALAGEPSVEPPATEPSGQEPYVTSDSGQADQQLPIETRRLSLLGQDQASHTEAGGNGQTAQTNGKRSAQTPTPPSNGAPPPSPNGRRKPETDLSDDWQPTAKHQDLADSLGVSMRSEVEHFRDYHLAKGSRFRDWDRAFNTWLRQAAKFAKARMREPERPDNWIPV